MALREYFIKAATGSTGTSLIALATRSRGTTFKGLLFPGGNISSSTTDVTLGIGNTGGTGTFTANGATPVTVANATVTANSQVLVTLKTVGGTVGTSGPNVRTITAGTGFTIAGIALDTSVYNYMIIG